MKKKVFALVLAAALVVTPFTVNGETLDDGGIVNGEIFGKGTETDIGEEILYSGGAEEIIEPELQGSAEDIGIAGEALSDDASNADDVAASSVQDMYRLYNPNSGEHFYTSNASERDQLVGLGWNDEGIGWRAPASGKTWIFRMYNPKAGYEEHHYTADENEIKALQERGWNLEGRAWASDEQKRVPVYRLFNPKSQNSASSHHYTADANERRVLIGQGWNDEGVGWYAAEKGIQLNNDLPPQPDPYSNPDPNPEPEPYSGLKVGDIIQFGSYEQDNNTANGKEPIEWLVLKKEKARALVISRYGLDAKRYNEQSADVTWSTCTLRRWLNSSFLKDAFSVSQQSCIREETVPAHKNPDFNTDPGPDTKDKVFLLSCVEAWDYFSSNTARQCKPTAYAKAQGADTSISTDYYGNCWWWLRSPGGTSNGAADVLDFGALSSTRVDTSFNCVRPALWIIL